MNTLTKLLREIDLESLEDEDFYIENGLEKSDHNRKSVLTEIDLSRSLLDDSKIEDVAVSPEYKNDNNAKT